MNPAAAEKSDDGFGARPTLGLPLGGHLFVWASFVVLGLGLFGVSRLYEGQNVWRSWTESGELRHSAYAERIYVEDVFRTQANTWSNLAYVIVGFYALALGGNDQRSRPARAGGYVIQTPAMSFLFGAACCYLGIGSGLFHASLTRWGQQLDVAAMYAPLLACFAMHLGRWACAARSRWGFPGARIWPVLTGLVVVTSYLLYRYKWSMSSRVVLTTLILLVALFGLLDIFFARRRLRLRWLGWSSVALIAAITCRQLDVAGKFSGPDAWFQGHAIWHVLTALSLACLYAYHRFEVSSGASAALPLRSQQL